MATAQVCDRCGKIYELSYIENIHKNIRNRYTSRMVAYMEPDEHKMVEVADLELCPECVASLRRWIEEPVTEGVI